MMLAQVCSVQAHINLSRLSHNLAVIRKSVGRKVAIMAVVKANAYGHGLVPIARDLFDQGVVYFGVARLEEALLLRKVLARVDILILSPIAPENFTLALTKKITLTLTEKSHLRLLNQTAEKLKIRAKIHLKVDTGLNRSGIEPEDTLSFTKHVHSFPHLDIEGVFTHFANAQDLPFSRKQLVIFNKIIKELRTNGLLPKLVHAAATGAIFRYPDSHFNLVRPGLGLYGHSPEKKPFKLKPILSLRTGITRIHQVKKNETVGYNRIYKVKQDLLAATISAGYADGLRRAPKSWPHATINGQLAPIIGRMSMDQAVIDISHIKPRPTLRSKALLLADSAGPQSLETIAAKIGTSPYEVLTSLHERVTRTYTKPTSPPIKSRPR